MKLIALSILSVGLCFYIAFRMYLLGKDSVDQVASFFAVIAALMVILGSNND